MALSKLGEQLATVPLFSGLTQRQLNRVAKVSQETSYRAADVLFKQGDVGQKLILITSGRARITRDGRRVAELGPGEVVGEMSLIDARPRSASVVAETDITALVIFKSDFRRMLETLPGLWEKLLVTQTARLRAADLDLEALG